eukprot:CAMPEP_0119043738 /NCGR_PEP_ID=MMETSP1177-20130426/25372_1 /TAXON_ID=2985 /ORGANISM="Ochromonas sp, Strain CCMP1899" /LENGTH=452 /DNA_ID=CAMNT_0007012503 /DNA_START=255 /DNA_END=1610 /DNA_ORIENTATION=+
MAVSKSDRRQGSADRKVKRIGSTENVRRTGSSENVRRIGSSENIRRIGSSENKEGQATAVQTEIRRRANQLHEHKEDCNALRSFFMTAGLSTEISSKCAEECILVDVHSTRRLFHYVQFSAGFSLLNLGMDKFDSDMVIEDLVRLYNTKGETPPMIDNKPFLPLSSSTKSEKKKERQKSLPSIAESSDDEYDNIVKKIKDTDVLKTVLKNTISSVSDQASLSRKSLTAFQKNTEKKKLQQRRLSSGDSLDSRLRGSEDDGDLSPDNYPPQNVTPFRGERSSEKVSNELAKSGKPVLSRTKSSESMKKTNDPDQKDDVADMEGFFRFAGLSKSYAKTCAVRSVAMHANSPKKLFKYLQVDKISLVDLGMDGVDSDMVQDILSKKYLKDNPPTGSKTSRQGLKSIVKSMSTDSDASQYNLYDSMDSEKSHSKFSSNLKDHLISPISSRSPKNNW